MKSREREGRREGERKREENVKGEGAEEMASVEEFQLPAPCQATHNRLLTPGPRNLLPLPSTDTCTHVHIPTYPHAHKHIIKNSEVKSLQRGK